MRPIDACNVSRAQAVGPSHIERCLTREIMWESTSDPNPRSAQGYISGKKFTPLQPPPHIGNHGQSKHAYSLYGGYEAKTPR